MSEDEDMCDNCYINYVAGFFDGEGSISILRAGETPLDSPYYTLAITISNQCESVIMDIQGAFGGSIRPDLRPEKPCYVLTMHADLAMEFLKTMFPFLKVKKEQAKLGITFREQHIKWSYKRRTEEMIAFYETMYKKMRDLNDHK